MRRGAGGLAGGNKEQYQKKAVDGQRGRSERSGFGVESRCRKPRGREAKVLRELLEGRGRWQEGNEGVVRR